jgi:hypothetical protein
VPAVVLISGSLRAGYFFRLSGTLRVYFRLSKGYVLASPEATSPLQALLRHSRCYFAFPNPSCLGRPVFTKIRCFQLPPVLRCCFALVVRKDSINKRTHREYATQTLVSVAYDNDIMLARHLAVIAHASACTCKYARVNGQDWYVNFILCRSSVKPSQFFIAC